MAKIFDVSEVFASIPKLLRYLPQSLLITAVSMILGLILGLLFALVRTKKVPVLDKIVVFFVSFIRGTPLLVQLYMTYYVIPMILRYINLRWKTSYSIKNVPDLLFVFITFGLNEAAYNSEIIRSALQSVQKGQIEAAESLGVAAHAKCPRSTRGKCPGEASSRTEMLGQDSNSLTMTSFTR